MTEIFRHRRYKFITNLKNMFNINAIIKKYNVQYVKRKPVTIFQKYS